MSALRARIEGFQSRRIIDRATGEWTDALERGGIGILAARVADEFGTRRAVERHEAEKRRAWEANDGQLYRSLLTAEVEPVIRAGFVLHHFASGRRMTPDGWLFEHIDDAVGAVDALLGDHWSRFFEGHLADIQHFGPWVIGVHRSHGCFTGRWHHIGALDAAIDEDAYEAGLAELRKGQACERWRVAQPVQGRAA